MFAAGKVNYSRNESIYGLVQCTRDLSGDGCNGCLTDFVSSILDCCGDKRGGRVLGSSCFVQFEMDPFFIMPTPSPSVPLSPPTTPLSPSPLSPPTGKKNNTLETVLFIVIPVVAVSTLLSAICIWFRRRRTNRKKLNVGDEKEFRSAESLLLDLGTLKAATNNFSDSNKLGEGGFGPVYKGTLPDGEEIAVKRLLRSSVQGLVQLRAEVVLVAKLQHRNLVRLLGCCIAEPEMLLVYEYLPNTSLDKFLFDPIKCAQLDWARRYKIIEGVARGLLYLHQDSRLKIIHRDLKASNILLDGGMNPKISDFGLAKLCNRDETHGSTSRIDGTYGYMAPEYVRHGRFSAKSDVFSYGVLVLEIVTGQRNSSFQGSGRVADLLSYVWTHWSEGTAFHVIDRSLAEGSQRQEVLRCIHIGLLCVQEDPTVRPSMSVAILKLSSLSETLPAPSVPAFFIQGSTATESDVLARQFSVNDMSNSEMDPR